MGMENESTICQEYDENGNLQAEYYMLDGKLEGQYLEYNTDTGVIKNILRFRGGKTHGTCKFFDDEGILTQIIQFKYGKMNGHMIGYEEGKRNLYGCYSNGKLNGNSLHFYPSGKLKVSLSYKLGKLDGPSYYFNEKGQKVSEANYENGKLHGDSIIYYPNGKIQQIERFDKGVITIGG
jgi:uncharacterized protein